MEKIQEFIKKAENLYNSGINAPEFKAWKRDVVHYLRKIYGDNSYQAVSFDNIDYYNYYFTYDVFNDCWKKNILKEKDTFNNGIKTAIYYLINYESDDYIFDFYEKEQKSANKTSVRTGNKSAKGSANKNVFIVNGRGSEKAKVERYLFELGINPIILNVDENEVKMSTNSGNTYFKIDQEGKWRLDLAKKLKALKKGA
jgi:hypothetical protein